MDAATLTLAGQIASRLVDEPSDGEQLAELTAALRVLREAVRDQEAAEHFDWLLADLEYFSRERLYAERESAREHERYMRRSAAYRKAEHEGAL